MKHPPHLRKSPQLRFMPLHINWWLLLSAILFCEIAFSKEPPIVSAHLMAQESPFILKSQAQDRSDPNGRRAQHLGNIESEAIDIDSSARADIARADSAGINTLNMLLGPNHLPRSYVSEMMKAYWRAAAQGPVKMGVDIWTSGSREEISKLAQALKILRDDYDSAWRKRDGRRVVLVMLTSKLEDVSISELERLFSLAGGYKSYYVVFYRPADIQKSNTKLLTIASGLTTWPHSDYANEIKLVATDEAAARNAGKDYWYPIMPSFMQARPAPGIIPNVREKLGATNFLADWMRALKNNCIAVNIATWNDLSEDSAVMPESNHGNAYADLNLYFSKRLNSNLGDLPQEERLLVFHHPQLVSGTKIPAGQTPIKAFEWMNRTPPTDYISVVALLKQKAKLRVYLNDRPVAPVLEVGSGLNHFLYYHPPKNSNSDAYISTDKNSQTILTGPFQAGKVTIQLSDDSGYSHIYISERLIENTAKRSDLTTAGDSFSIER